jgi:Icc-related predicted phosphoesterase
MRICGISDMHGNYDFNVETCDIVLICGDIVPLDIQKNLVKSEEWLKTFFIPWCTNLPCEKVVFIGGNHDFICAASPTVIREALKGQDKVIYLDCETYEYKGKVIYGTPLCKKFYNWAFMALTLDEQREMYERHLKAIGKIDIIMSHDCPYGINDIILQEDCWWADGSHIGNTALRWFIDETKPTLWLEGHLHTCEHSKVMHGDTALYNVSLLNENYEMTYEPTYIDIEL